MYKLYSPVLRLLLDRENVQALKSKQTFWEAFYFKSKTWDFFIGTYKILNFLSVLNYFDDMHQKIYYYPSVEILH